MSRLFTVPLVVALVVPLVGAPPAAADPPAPDDVTLTTLEIAVPVVRSGAIDPASVPAGADVAAAVAAPGRVLTEQLEPGDFQTLGVVWDDGVDGAALGVQVRTRVDGVWGAWLPLDVEPDPTDPDTPEGQRGRPGTDSLWVGDADGVQLSFAAQARAASVELVLIDVPETAAGAASTAPAGSAAATIGGARVVTRAEWNAQPPKCEMLTASEGLTSAVVHHTAGSNSYSTAAQAMAMLRGDQKYHMEARDWCDLGYNFVVDKWGNIYEGRQGSLTSARVGVHASGWNTGTVGVSIIGNYTDFAPSAAAQEAVARVIGARLGEYGVNPNSNFTYTNVGYVPSAKMPLGLSTQSRVVGHRQTAYTTCPGVPMQNNMPALRAKAQAFAVSDWKAHAVVTSLYHDLLGRGPDASGLATWTAVLARGATNARLVEHLTDSEEYRRLRIAQAYRETLGREPEAAGMANWLSGIRGGLVTVDDVRRTFLASAEFRLASGGTDRGYVQRLYRTVLGREATPEELAAGTAAVAEHGRPRYTDGLWYSQEAAEYRAGAYYEVFLKRTWDASGRTHWARVLLAHGEGAVRIGIAGSVEYANKALLRYPQSG